MAVRQLTGLRYSSEEAGPIIEDLDPVDWGAYCHRPMHRKAATKTTGSRHSVATLNNCLARNHKPRRWRAW